MTLMIYSYKDDEESLTYVINRLVEMQSKLTGWERTFIHQIKHKRDTYTGGYELSDRQKEIISVMWENY